MNRIGIDIGGTFTDIAGVIDGHLYHAKAPSSPDVVTGIVEGVGLLKKAAGVADADHLQIIHIHGTTIATNALLERKGAILAVLATEGHRDHLELGRMKRTHLYDLHAAPETPGFLAPRRQRVGIRERIGGHGEVLTPLDEAQVIAEVGRLKDLFGIEAVAVSYLNSYLNPVHERRTAELLAVRFPDLAISLSSDINPVFREYERVCCTAFDAYVRPKVGHYVRQLAGSLVEGEDDARLHLMQSRGGITSSDEAARRPVTMFLSGPAAGVVAGAFVGGLSDRGDLITVDVGGTSTDVALIRAGDVQISTEGHIDRYPLRIPMVDMDTIGSGGGSIAWIDEGGGLHVGPHSAGSMPGPACYGRGGTEPTSTDASIVLGHINPGYFANGTMSLQPDLSHQVIAGLAERVALTKVEAALGIYRILVSQMAEAIKLVSVKKGVDPRGFALVSFGGGGGLYCPAIALELGIREVLVPRSPGTLSAFGLLVSDVESDFVRSHAVGDAARADIGAMEAAFAAMEAEGAAKLAEEGIEGLAIVHRRSADMRYAGQAYELAVPVAAEDGEGGPMTAGKRARLVADFHAEHLRFYGHANDERRVEIVNLRVVSAQAAPDIPRDVLTEPGADDADAAHPPARQAVFPGLGVVETSVYNRSALAIGEEVSGPAIVEQPDTTLVIHDGQTAVVDAARNLIVRCI